MPEALYPFAEIETKWQAEWLKSRPFRALEPSEANGKKKLYVLDMFPYPSGSGLHVGHPEGYTATDIYSRFKRMQGYNVLHPMGWDAFGLPAEQYAIETGTHPAVTTAKNIATFKRQIQRLGLSYDWDREVDTTDPEYFRWTQWIFLQLYHKGLAYLAEVPVWWCEALGCVLANEEVVDGKSERGGHPVVRRPMRQWMLKITAYADRLLDDLKLVDWPDSIKEMQKNWIGRSEGAWVDFAAADEKIRVFTTRPDTLFGATYMVLSPEHPLVSKLTAPDRKNEIQAYQNQAASKSEMDRTELAKEKSGVFTGAFATNPVNEKKIPIWLADYVLASYGTGAIMAVPAHDERDYAFAKKFGLEIVEVIQGGDVAKEAFAGDGKNVNSGFLDGLPTPEAKKKMIAWLEEKKLGTKAVNYKLRDWLFARQRYWGEPIPVVHCAKCGIVPLPESELPLRLPEMKDFAPKAHPPLAGKHSSVEPPLSKAKDWLATKCPKCSGPAQRETNTMPQWAGSCWYYLRYIDPKNSKRFCDPEKEKYWMPVDLYVGGAEHAVLHLLYSRFWHKVLFDLGHVSSPEPFTKLVNQGMILGEDGQKMSKSRGNVINPDFIVDHYGADSMRLYEMFMGPLIQMKAWSMKGVEGVYRFLGRVWSLSEGDPSRRLRPMKDRCDLCVSPALFRLVHKTVKKVTEDLERLQFNTAISALMILSNELSVLGEGTVGDETIPDMTTGQAYETFLTLLSPFAPHLAEELNEKNGSKTRLSSKPWPAYDPKLVVDETIEIPIMINGKVRSRIIIVPDLAEAEVEKLVMQDEKVRSELSGKSIQQKKYVPRKIYTLAVS